MDFKSHFEKAWQLTLANIIPLVLMTLVFVFVSVLSLGILGPVAFAGYLSAIMRMLRENREPQIQDLFSQKQLFLPLLAFGVICFVIVMVGFMLLMIPGIIALVAISLFCLYTIPYMIDEQLGLVDAIKKSVEMVKGNIPEHAIALIIMIGINWIGGLVVVGWLFSQPLTSIFLISIYLQHKI